METTKITCDCRVCNGKGALMPKHTIADLTSKTVVHNLVNIAHRFAAVASVRENGPWKV